MSTNTALLTASLAALAFAVPAQAQDAVSAAPADEIVYESYEVVQGAADPEQYDEAYEEAYEKPMSPKPMSIPHPAIAPCARSLPGPPTIR